MSNLQSPAGTNEMTRYPVLKRGGCFCALLPDCPKLTSMLSAAAGGPSTDDQGTEGDALRMLRSHSVYFQANSLVARSAGMWRPYIKSEDDTERQKS